jgi:YtkA-like
VWPEFSLVSSLKGACVPGGEKHLRSFRNRPFQSQTLVAAISIVLWIGCNRKADPSSALAIAFEATPQPVHVGAVTVNFTLTDAASKPVTGAHLTTEADMTHAGMSPAFGAVEEKQPGRYESTLKLDMSGDWVILLHGTLPAGEKLEKQFELRNVRPN